MILSSETSWPSWIMIQEGRQDTVDKSLIKVQRAPTQSVLASMMPMCEGMGCCPEHTRATTTLSDHLSSEYFSSPLFFAVVC
jgi:hypothetical protein